MKVIFKKREKHGTLRAISYKGKDRKAWISMNKKKKAGSKEKIKPHNLKKMPKKNWLWLLLLSTDSDCKSLGLV